MLAFNKKNCPTTSLYANQTHVGKASMRVSCNEPSHIINLSYRCCNEKLHTILLGFNFGIRDDKSCYKSD